MNPILQYLLIAVGLICVVDVQGDAVQDAFNQFLAENSAYREDEVYGIGPPSTHTLMHQAQFKYELSTVTRSGNKTNAGEVPLNYVSMAKALLQCRFDGYLQYCNNPFKANVSADAPNYDIAAPYGADYSINTEPLDTPNSPDVQNFPMFTYGVTPIFNIPGVSKLVLTLPTLAKIFRGCSSSNAKCIPGSITMWNDSAIKDTNDPAIHSILDTAGPIKVMVRSDAAVISKLIKTACASADSDFRTQIGVDKNPQWNGTNVIKVFGQHGSLQAVRSTPFSIGYGLINLISEQVGLQLVGIQNSHGNVVYANSDSLSAAFQEIGLAFGNDGSSPDKLRVDLSNATGPRVWPMSAAGYLILRVNQTGANCVSKKSTVLHLVEYLYTEQGADSKVFTDGFAPMTIDAGAQMLEIVRSRVRCDGNLVYKYPPPIGLVTLQVDESMKQPMTLLGSAFSRLYPSNLEIQSLGSDDFIQQRFACLSSASCTDFSDGYLVLANENQSAAIIRNAEGASYKLFAMPFCAMAIGFIHNFCDASNTATTCPYNYQSQLVLSIEVAAQIFDQQITWWNDSRIQELNPQKVLPTKPIVVVAGPKTTSFHSTFIDIVRSSYLPSFSFSGGGSGLDTYLEAWVGVSVTPYSISFVPFNGSSIEGVSKVSVLSRQGVAVEPNSATTESCAMDTYDHAANVFHLSNSQRPDCYPLVQVFNMFMPQSVKSRETGWLAQYIYRQSLRDREATVSADTLLSVSDLGTLSDLQLPDVDLAQQNFLRLESLTLLSGDHFLMVGHDLNLIPDSAIYVMYALLALELFSFTSLAIWVLYYRKRKLMRNSSPVFMLQVLLGAAVMACTVIPLAQQDSYLAPRGMTAEQLAQDQPNLDSACVAQPFLFSIGFFITFSALFLKAWRLIKIFDNKKLRLLYLKDRQLLVYQASVLCVVLVLNLVWALRDPLVWIRFPIFTDSESGLIVASYGICFSRGGVSSALPLIIGVMLVLVVGNYLSYLGRHIPTEFNESKWTAIAMVMTLEAFCIGLPVLVLANNQPISGFIIKSISALLVPGATVVLIFVPKLAIAYGWGGGDDSNPWRFVQKSGGSNGASKKEGNGTQEHRESKKDVSVNPSLQSFMTGKGIGASDKASKEFSVVSPFAGDDRKLQSSPVGSKKTFAGLTSSSSFTTLRAQQNSTKDLGTTSEALAKILQDDPMRRRFRRYLQTLKMEENLRFWDAGLIFRSETDPQRRYVSARSIIQTFVLDTAPLQVSLSSNTKDAILAAYNNDERAALSNVDFFNPASGELFEDLRQSDAFRTFVQNDTFSQNDLNNSKSDPTL